MESRQSNKEAAIQRGGNENGSCFVIRDVFSSFSLLISGKEYQVVVSLGSRSPFALPARVSVSQPLPFPLFQFTYWHVAFRDTEGISFSRFIPFFFFFFLGFCFISLRLLSHNDVIHFVGASLTVPNVMPGSVFIPRLTAGCFHSEVLSGGLSTLTG